MMQEVIIDTQTNEVSTRDLGADEIALIEANKLVEKANEDKIIAHKASKSALLEKLGITEDEARLLLG